MMRMTKVKLWTVVIALSFPVGVRGKENHSTGSRLNCDIKQRFGLADRNHDHYNDYQID